MAVEVAAGDLVGEDDLVPVPDRDLRVLGVLATVQPPDPPEVVVVVVGVAADHLLPGPRPHGEEVPVAVQVLVRVAVPRPQGHN